MPVTHQLMHSSFCTNCSESLSLCLELDHRNLPIVSEGHESKLIDKFVDAINPHVEPSLGAIMPRVYLNAIKTALDEKMSVRDRKDKISRLLRGELAEPLALQLNERIDSGILPEQVEGKVLGLVANQIIEEFVEWTVGQVDEQLEEAYNEAMS